MNYLNYHTGRPRFHFEEGAAGGADGAAAAAAAASAAAAAAAASAAKPWHDGVETETIDFWKNKGYEVTDPKALATKLTRQYREAEKFIGAPPDQVFKLPKADAKPEEIAAMWQRLGAPKEAKEYDFSGIKFAGADLEPAFADAMRAGLAAAFVPKDKAGAIVTSVVKYLESADTTESTLNSAKLTEERGKLEENWGNKESNTYRFNMLAAKEGASRLGLDPEATTTLEGLMGYSTLMDALRRIGNARKEDVFVESGPAGANGKVTTREGAMSRKSELFADKGWVARLNAGDQEAKTEWKRLNVMIEGEM